MNDARVLEVCVGGVRVVENRSQSVSTGIYKTPVTGPVRASGINLTGDHQADREVHGGPLKAVYAFPVEHYQSWREAFPDIKFESSAFGENLTTIGVTESDVRFGDQIRCGSAVFTVTQPRLPCFKLGIKTGDDRTLKHMIETKQTGFYFSITIEGTIQAGDKLELVSRLDGSVPIVDLVRVYSEKTSDQAEIRRLLDSQGMIEQWRSWLETKITRL